MMTADIASVAGLPARVQAQTDLPDRVQADLARLKEVTGQVVGSVFFGTLLKTMRDSELNGPLGHGGRGEKVFAAQLHGLYAEQAGSSVSGGLKEVLFQSLEAQQRRISLQQPVEAKRGITT